MPTLTGTIHDVTGEQVSPTDIRRVFVKAPKRRAAEEGVLIVTAPVDLGGSGELAVDLEPGPAVLVIDTGVIDTIELHVTADMTLITEAMSEAESGRGWQESVMVRLLEEARAEAQRAVDAAEHVDDAIAGAADQVVQAVEQDRVRAEDARTGAETAAGDASSSATTAEGHATAAGQSALSASDSAGAAASSATDADQSATDSAASATAAGGHASTAADHASAAGTARAGAEDARDDALGHAQDAAQSAVGIGDQLDIAEGHATSAGQSASDAASDAVRSEAARDAAVAARGQSEGFADVAGAAATDAGVSASTAGGHADDAEVFRDAAGDHRVAAEVARDESVSSASDAATSAGQAEDERVVAQDAATVAEGHAQAAGTDAGRAEDAAAVAEAQRWTIRGDWSEGSYDAGDVVIFEERAYYAESATSVSPPEQPWIPLTPAGGGGASHWDYLDGVPTVFPPKPHDHDAAEVSGDATPLLDVSEASVGEWSVSEAFDAASDASGISGEFTDDAHLGMMMMPSIKDDLTWDHDNPVPARSQMVLGAQAMVLLFPMMDQVAALESGKADTVHTHSLADVDGLTDALDARPDRDEIEARGPQIVRVTELPADPDPETLYIVVEA